ncbi:rhodanese-like domain-containing protein [Shewanella sp. Choline-02u-19]|jgi:rhodanese-related sulfurtransferase|uniref:rhodanese-like domain-containing protein n=1 Tax=Shewanella TaxID=22 RepID=UPI000C345EB6|nr:MULTISPECIES: rhodanese-like domain-containing protein [Shewanella]MCL1059359.1 rhodanese-like domain-containing protein [Shewanella gelidimarina]PKG56865.1 rhodanese-like domain-containing protein [Shewanella sp. GutDb-MelDb]PKG74699.1 rhodanese-like domain-containing protein [Shewanella sp. GutCb]PKH56079.1 rhodanese-like domain-containing protein [Shewanella sp. Bg11-22]PKI30667.1 rhodanese-like domain-containing protein [Shewanella sp. Choline-02u-19]
MQEYMEFFKANPMLSLAWVGLFVGLIVMVFKSSVSKVKNVNHQEATLLMNKQEATVVDVRGKEEFKKGHIVGAINVPLAEIKNNQLGTLENSKASPIIMVCNAGMTSSQAAQLMVKHGFENVNNLKGGMGEWQSSNLPVSKSKR